MIVILRSLSARFYLALGASVGALMVALLFYWRYWMPSGPALSSFSLLLFVFLVLLVPLPLVFALFYWLFGLAWPAPQWQKRNISFPERPAVTLPAGDQPYWAKGKATNAGTLRDFIRQHLTPDEEDDTKFRIGIVLAGGGAKGVYQAGALQALWEFFDGEKALQYVRVVTGTSIGAWNSMFWLADRIADGTLRDWWTSVRPAQLVGPTFYLPFCRNYVLHNNPWRGQFNSLFAPRVNPLLAGGPPFFYLTNTNVRLARLDLVTNHSLGDTLWQLTAKGYVPTDPIVTPQEGRYQATTPEQLRTAVFGSMDIPPAFRRITGLGGEEWEDGGVIDNLPIRYATFFDGCNLLFVLPLNASFEEPPSERLILQRMFRVMNIRQGVLERDAVRDIGLYNTLIGAGKHIGRNMHKKRVTTFCICPEPALEMDTFAFWKTRTAGPSAFQLMYEATWDQLKRFDFSVTNWEVWMARVRSNGQIVYKDFTLT